MIKLTSPVLWDGRLILAGTILGLPSAFEEQLIRAGNATYGETSQQKVVEPEILKTTEPQASVDDGTPDETDLPEPEEPELILGRGALMQ